MSDDSKEWVNNIGSICTSREGNNLYINIRKDITLKAGDNLRMVKTTEDIDRKVASGVMTEDEGEAQKAKLHFVKYTLHRPPRK